MVIREWLAGLADVLWPHVCEVCGTTLVDGEHTLCLSCRLSMPYTYEHRRSHNAIHERLADTGVPLCKGAAMMRYNAGTPYARLLVKSKYNNKPWIDRDLAEMFAQQLHSEGWFDGMDCVMAVPMHRLKQWGRGYNQSAVIAEGVSRVTGLPVYDNLKCHRRHKAQATLNRKDRMANAEGVYSVVDGTELDGKHILVVDDIITTGSTMLACCHAIMQASATARLSVLSLGLTQSR